MSERTEQIEEILELLNNNNMSEAHKNMILEVTKFEDKVPMHLKRAINGLMENENIDAAIAISLMHLSIENVKLQEEIKIIKENHEKLRKSYITMLGKDDVS